MTVKQLLYIVSVTDNQFNISYAAEKLFTSQPGISKQIRLLEEKLGCEIFVRNGKALQGLTEKGEILVRQARIVLTEYDNLVRMAKNEEGDGESFSIATTSTQSAYVLPPILHEFHLRFPKLKLNIQDGNMDQLMDIAGNREADCIILSGINDRLNRDWFRDMLMIPCYEWYQILLCPDHHVLAQKKNITIKDLAEYRIITYPPSKRETSALGMQLENSGLSAEIFATSNDPKSIKNYVAAGMGIGVLAPMAYDKRKDVGLTAISLEGILPKCTTIIAVERHNILKPHVYQFIKLFAPHLTNEAIELAINNESDIVTSETDLPGQLGAWEGDD